MKNKWPYLSKAPIVEGLIDLRIDGASGLTLGSLKSACDELAAEFPLREEMHSFSGQISFAPKSGPSLSLRSPEHMGFVIKSVDQKWVAQFRLDGFTISRLQPYSTWDDLEKRARDLWQRYRDVAKPEKIVRVASRFINRIPLPVGETFDKTFVTTFNIPADLPQTVSAFLLRVVFPFVDEQCFVIATQSLPTEDQDCTFDLDAIAERNEGFSESEAWSKLSQLRDVKNQVFFASLTREALENFK